jgi:hypothetical protein
MNYCSSIIHVQYYPVQYIKSSSCPNIPTKQENHVYISGGFTYLSELYLLNYYSEPDSDTADCDGRLSDILHLHFYGLDGVALRGSTSELRGLHSNDEFERVTVLYITI